MTRRVAFQTLGCRVNLQDTEQLGHRGLARGFRDVDFQDEADVYVINSCTVTHQADREARKLARRARRRNPAARVIVTGCYAEVDAAALRAMPEVDLVVGNLDKERLFEMLEALDAGDLDPAAPLQPVSRARELDVPVLTEVHRHVRPMVKVQDGCNHRCTFCIIPRARGRSRSSPPARVREQLEVLGRAGVQEATLTGIHIASWGRDLGEGHDLESLLGELAAAPGLPRLRISSIEPVDMTPGTVRLMARHPERFCRHLHMAVQSGSDRVLARMNRRYTRTEFLNRARQVFEEMPDIGVGLDVLVGFPGETDEDFEETLDLVGSLPFAYVHAFPYSRRPGTRAADWEAEHLPPPAVKARMARLLDLAASKRRAFLGGLVGTRCEAVVVKSRGDGTLECVTDHYAAVRVAGADAHPGDRVEIEVATLDAEVPRANGARVLARGPAHASAMAV